MYDFDSLLLNDAGQGLHELEVVLSPPLNMEKLDFRVEAISLVEFRFETKKADFVAIGRKAVREVNRLRLRSGPS